ncbi:30S ribosomal protein S16 [bacterium]|nr:30S ribosomal protein S16 [bacterium]
MVKIRLKRLGYKKNPSYRIVAIDSRCKREGAPIEELGYYNPKSKEMKLNVERAKERLSQGAQASETVMYLINNANADGSLNYKKSEKQKISKKAQAKIDAQKAEEQAQAQAENAEA